MKFEEFLNVLSDNGDTVGSIALIELPADLYKKWQRKGVIRKKAFMGCPVFRGVEGVLYQRLNREVVTVGVS